MIGLAAYAAQAGTFAPLEAMCNASLNKGYIVVLDDAGHTRGTGMLRDRAQPVFSIEIGGQ